ncbi:tryptophan halogenase family protein [Asticcacaulis endophyticus]|uniref:Tryptophan halogenase n=1 Tax=Asticcacaulis endophyticus TaxID=1395890 RepID=A0A918Q923_9CAUL|nr:tryptophan halogenase family protein [Asticcacaulis endophyticus]GGZ36015.1 tryptophan halogenase [Asticcacaulis endophyticus]
MHKLKVVIVGGGTSGWMCAAAFAGVTRREQVEVQLIESDEIGTVGVGEATLPHIKDFNDYIGINEAEFMRKTQATIKLGIEFVDWGKIGNRYFHPFGKFGAPMGATDFFQMWLRARAEGLETPLEDFCYAIVASKQNRFEFPSRDGNSVKASYAYAYHFDAFLYARFLREFSEARGIVRIEGKITDVTLNQHSGDIRSVTLASGEVVTGDLFIDCSGFRGLLISGALKVGYEDWTGWLPCDRAVAVPCDRTTNEITPYTRSTARAAGWQWRIPLQHRTGNGYVYSSRFISDDEAAATLMANLDGAAQADPRPLRFTAGRRDKCWHKNCVTIGLASGFLEPLESTSIYLVQMAITFLLRLLPRDRVIDQTLEDEFNRLIDVEYERVRDFLILHYHANTRTDAPMWQYCRDMDIPDSLRDKIARFKHRGYIHAYADGLFAPPSWQAVFFGQDITPERYDALAEAMDREALMTRMTDLRTLIREGVATMPGHDDFIRSYCDAGKAMEAVR